MSVVVNVSRETELHGRPMLEKWTLVYGFSGEGVSVDAEVEMVPAGDSRDKYHDHDVDRADVPFAVLELAEKRFEEALEATTGVSER